MKKLTNQSPLFDITNRINDIIDSLDGSEEVYLNFKPNIGADLTRVYTNEDVPVSYDVAIMGVYKIELNTSKASVPYELFINGESKKGTLSKNKNTVENIFMSKGDKIIFREKTLGEDDLVTISFEMNVLEAFTKEYESVQNNIGIVSEISKENSKQMENVKELIENFSGSLSVELATKEELKALLDILEA